VTQPIQPDRPTPPIADRDRSKATRTASSAATAGDAGNAAATIDSADLRQGSALLRSSASAPGSGAIAAADEARSLATRVAVTLATDPARALQAYAAMSREAVQGLLAMA
jgi:hypothetical protein